MGVLEPETEGHPGARRLSRLGAVEDHLAVAGNQRLCRRMQQEFRSNRTSAGNAVWRGFDIQGGPQVYDHEGIASLQPLFELERGDPRLPEMTEEALPPR